MQHMVAIAFSNASITVPASALAGRGGLVQFTVEDILSMLRQGMVTEDASAELLNGFIVHTDRSAQGGDPAMHSPGHRKSVRRLTALVASIDSIDRHVQIQSPVVCGLRQMPEPDFAIIRGNDDKYTGQLPTATDVLCLIEVADSSLERDRSEKLPIYATSGIPQYIILNLRNRTAEIFENPDIEAGSYPPPRVISEDGLLSLQIGENRRFDANLVDLLP